MRRDQSGLFYRGSLLNHSCEPNTVPAFFGPVMACFAVADIAKGAEVTAPYCDTARNHRARRALLQKWNFDCESRRCVRGESAPAGPPGEPGGGLPGTSRFSGSGIAKVASLRDALRRVPGAEFLLARVLLLGAHLAQAARDKPEQQRYLRALAAPEALRAAEADTLVRECICHGYLAGRMTTSDENDDSDEWNAVARQWLTLELFPEALVEYTLRALRASFYQYKRDGAAAAAAAVAGRMTTMRRRRKLK